MNIDIINYKKYLKYKKKYYNLKIQIAGQFSEESKQKIINLIFPNQEKKNNYAKYIELLKGLFAKLELYIEQCTGKDDEDIEKEGYTFLICKINEIFKIIPLDDKESKQNQDNITTFFSKKFGEDSANMNGDVFVGNLFGIKDDLTNLIKIPKTKSNYTDDENLNRQLNLIREAYINFVIINNFILENPKLNNLIFTFGLLFTPNCKNENGICTEQFNINLIQQTLTKAKSLKEIIEENIDLSTFVNYLNQIFNQLSLLEESEFKLIHGDLHYENILISNDKAYIIDWGDSSFIYNKERFRSINNYEYLYFKSEKDINIKTGLYDLYVLLGTCLSLKNKNINDFINKLLDKIFFSGEIKIYNYTKKQSEIFNKEHLDNGWWLYNVIGGNIDGKVSSIQFNDEIYNNNKPHFTKYTYSKILDDITELYQSKKCKKN